MSPTVSTTRKQNCGRILRVTQKNTITDFCVAATTCGERERERERKRERKRKRSLIHSDETLTIK